MKRQFTLSSKYLKFVALDKTFEVYYKDNRIINFKHELNDAITLLNILKKKMTHLQLTETQWAMLIKKIKQWIKEKYESIQ